MKLLIFISIATLFQVNAVQMTGGWSPVTDKNSSDFMKFVYFAANEISVALGGTYIMRPIEVLSAEKQVVSGMNYRFNIRIGATSCKINDNNDVDINECEFLRGGAVQNCNATVWDRKWLNETRLTKYACDKETDSS